VAAVGEEIVGTMERTVQTPGAYTLTYDDPTGATTTTGLPSVAGTYALNVWVDGYAYKDEATLQVAAEMLDENGQPEPGPNGSTVGHRVELVNAGDDEPQAKASYYLEDQASPSRDASEIEIWVLNEDIKVLGRAGGPTQVAMPHRDITVELSGWPRTVRAVWTGADDHPELRRDHQPGRIMASNTSWRTRFISIEKTTMATPDCKVESGGHLPTRNSGLISPAFAHEVHAPTATVEGDPVNTGSRPHPYSPRWLVRRLPPKPAVKHQEEFADQPEAQDWAEANTTHKTRGRDRGTPKDIYVTDHVVNLIGAHLGWEAGDPGGTSMTQPSVRLSFIWREAVLRKTARLSAAERERCATVCVVHELGHMLLHGQPNNGGHHKVPGVDETVRDNADSADPSVRAKALRDVAYYSGPLYNPAAAPTRWQDYALCAMHEETPWEIRATRFCPYHAALMANYDWEADNHAGPEGD
jgi:hypothetical protein